MQHLHKVNQAAAAVLNRRLIVHLLRQDGPLSRRQLADRSGLRSSSLTYIARELMDRGVIRTFGKLNKPGAGKKHVLLEVNPDLGWVLGVGVDGDSAALVCLDAKGQMIDRDRVPLRESLELLPQLLRTRIDSWVARRGAPPGELLGVGVGISGVVDPDRGLVLRSTRFKLENWDLGLRLRDAFGTRVAVDNDSNFAALAESRLGSAADHRNFLYILVNAAESGARHAIKGFGSSLFIHGELFRGAHFGSGEIDALLDGDSFDTVTAEQLLAVAAPDGPFNGDLHRLADRLTNTLVAMVDLFDPEAVVIGGNVGLANRAMLDYVQTQLNARIVPLPRRHVLVRPSMFMDHGVSMGAAIAALDDALLTPENEPARASA